MNRIPCGDCGKMLSPDAKGCSTCGRNIAAERKLFNAFIWIALAIVVILLTGILLGVLVTHS